MYALTLNVIFMLQNTKISLHIPFHWLWEEHYPKLNIFILLFKHISELVENIYTGVPIKLFETQMAKLCKQNTSGCIILRVFFLINDRERDHVWWKQESGIHKCCA